MCEYRTGDLYRIVAPPFYPDATTVKIHLVGEDSMIIVEVGRIVMLVSWFFVRERIDFAHVMIDDKMCEIDIALISPLV